MLERSHFSDIVCRELGLECGPGDMSEWQAMLDRIANRHRSMTIALVGKYVKLHDAYLSVVEALAHGGYENGARVNIRWVDSETVNDSTVHELLGGVDGILVPGGFGERGVEGKICAARYAREQRIPYLGICLGMQVSVIEFGRNVLHLEDANSSEFNEHSAHPVIDLMPDQQGNVPKGGTMRLGTYPCCIRPGSIMDRAYGQPLIHERHRHRYEFNNAYREQYEAGGMTVTGASPDNRLVEAIELKDHPFFVGVQYHPEFKSRPNRAHPLFREFIAAALRHQG